MKHFAPVIATLSLLLATAPASAQDFRMDVFDAFTISNEGVAMTGTVAGGPVAVDDVVCLRPAEGERQEATVTKILDLRNRRAEVASAEPGMMVALLFADLADDSAEGGDTLTASCG